MIYVAAAGPMANFILAALSAVLFHPAGLLPDPAADWLRLTLLNSIVLNLILAVLNLPPLPPLDGGRIAVGLWPLGPDERRCAVEGKRGEVSGNVGGGENS